MAGPWVTTLVFGDLTYNFFPFRIITNCCVLITVTFRMVQISSKHLAFVFSFSTFSSRILNSLAPQWNFPLRRNASWYNPSEGHDRAQKNLLLNIRCECFQVAFLGWKHYKKIFFPSHLEAIDRQNPWSTKKS